MADNRLVSIITPSFNCADYIGQTIESIQAQTYPEWELLVTDDCSTDNSREIIRRYADRDNRIRLFKLDKNSGAGVARNNSIKEAKGRYIAFCDSDDRWYPDKLQKQLAFMAEKDCPLSYTSYDTCDEKGKRMGYVECLDSLSYTKIIRDNGIGCLTAMYDCQKIGKHYMPSIRKRQDWCLWIDIIRHHGKAFGLKQPLALYRVRSGSISSNKIEMLRYNFNVYHDILKFNRFASCLMLGGYFLPYYFYKKFKQKLNYRNK